MAFAPLWDARIAATPRSRNINAPLPQVKIVPTGGVSRATAKEFIAAGAWALGVGSDLVNTAAIKDGKSQVQSCMRSSQKHYRQ